jgi:tRNA-dihydrouridine synthase B
MAAAAQLACAHGADIIDINMGCPAKKVCNKLAGSALLRDEQLVAQILTSVVQAVDVPVTLKTRTGWDVAHRNGVNIAHLAQECGIQALTMHGRTRACGYRGQAEYDTIAACKQAVGIPVIANGDISTAEQARDVLAQTGADGLMLGRAAYGNPWLFGEIKARLSGNSWSAPSPTARIAVMHEHLDGLHSHYGSQAGTRIARKHIGWYLAHLPVDASWRTRFNTLETAAAQSTFLDALDNDLAVRIAA